MKFVVEIKTDNAAFSPSPDAEVARILSVAAWMVDGGFFKYKDDEAILWDLNGNRVGVAKFVETEA